MSKTDSQEVIAARAKLVTPDLEGIPEDDAAEPEDAGIEHDASEEEVMEVGA